MKSKNADYDKLTGFRQELQNIVLRHLQTEMPTVQNQWQKNEVSYFITQITKDKNHPLHPQLEIIQFFNAILGEIEKYIKELEFSRDPSTRQSGIQFLTMVLNAIKIIGALHAEELTVRINRKDYTIKGLTGYRSVVTFWLVEYPTQFAKYFDEFHTKWKNFGVENIIPKLDPIFSPRAIKVKNKNEMGSQENDVSSNSDAVLSESLSNTSSRGVLQSKSEVKIDGTDTHISGTSTDIGDLKENMETRPARQTIEGELECATEEESDEARSDEKVGSRSTHVPTAHQVRESDEEANDDDEYTYEDYYVDEDEEESGDDTEEFRSNEKVAVPKLERNDQQRSQLTQEKVDSDAEESVEKKTSQGKKRSKIIRTPIKRWFIDTDGRSCEEEIYEEILIEDGESVTPPRTPGNADSPVKGLSLIKRSNPALFGRLQRLSMDRKNFSVSTATPTEADEAVAHQKMKSTELSPMSALLADCDSFVKERSLGELDGVTNLDGPDVEYEGDEEHETTASRALNFGSSGSDTE
ncbi:MAG: hypothetical protein K2X50_06395 [Gammaproteobacteria bacterium]|nr:hypothetical protein [Gammaproteobacteria bacterium]